MREKLSDADVKSRLASVPGWTLNKDEISRTIKLDSFPAALLLACAVGQLAQTADHHPDILIKYVNVTFTLTTHDANGLTSNDFSLAQKINALLK